jgi:hypothetical protein
LLPNGLQRLVDLFFQLLLHRLQNLIHLLQYGGRDLALHLLQDGVNGLSDLVFEHLTQIHFRAQLLPVIGRRWFVTLVPPGRLILLRLFALLGALSSPCLCPDIGFTMLPIRRGFLWLLIGLAAGAARRAMLSVIPILAARTRLGGLRMLPL